MTMRRGASLVTYWSSLLSSASWPPLSSSISSSVLLLWKINLSQSSPLLSVKMSDPKVSLILRPKMELSVHRLQRKLWSSVRTLSHLSMNTRSSTRSFAATVRRFTLAQRSWPRFRRRRLTSWLSSLTFCMRTCKTTRQQNCTRISLNSTPICRSSRWKLERPWTSTSTKKSNTKPSVSQMPSANTMPWSSKLQAYSISTSPSWTTTRNHCSRKDLMLRSGRLVMTSMSPRREIGNTRRPTCYPNGQRKFWIWLMRSSTSQSSCTMRWSVSWRTISKCRSWECSRCFKVLSDIKY